MIKNIFSVFILLFLAIFFYFVFNTYFSMNKEIQNKTSRKSIIQTIENNFNRLPILVNDTNDVIEFNSGFENENTKIKRNFWKLFEKND